MPRTLKLGVTHVHAPTLARQFTHTARMWKRERNLKPVRPSHVNELWYKAELLKITRALKSSAAKNMHAVGDTVAIGDSVRARGITSAMSRDFGGIEDVARRLSGLVVQKNLAAVDARLRASLLDSVKIDIGGYLTMDGPIREAMQEATEANVALITSIPAQFFDRIEQAIDANQTGDFAEGSLAGWIAHIGDVTDSRAKLIARDQTSKLNSSFNETRQTGVGIRQYTWQTAGDERVRESHAEHDGQVFYWDDPPEETGHPGDDVNCRCVAIPYFDLDAMEAALDDDDDQDGSIDGTEQAVTEAE